jgi:hypothetical protein
MADKNVNIKITVDGDDAKKGLDKAKTGVNDLKNSSGKAFDFMKSKWLAVSAGIAAGAVAIKKALDFANIFSDFKEQADLLTSNFGINTEKLVKRVSEATNGMVSNVEIVKGATKAFSLGAAQNIDDVSKMFQIAEVQGKISGRSMEEAFNIITEAVGRGRPGMLAQIGFSKELIETWEQQAKATGGVLDSQTLLNGIMSQGAKNLEKASAAGLSFGDKMKILKSSLDNVKLAIGEGVARALDPVVDSMRKFASNADSLKKVKEAVIVIVSALQILGNIIVLNQQLMYAFVMSIVSAGKVIFDVFDKIRTGKLSPKDLFSLDTLKQEFDVAAKNMEKPVNAIKDNILGIVDTVKNVKKQIDSVELGDIAGGGETSTAIQPRRALPSDDKKSIYNDAETFQKKYETLVENSENNTLETRLKALEELKKSKYANGKELIAIEDEIQKTQQKIVLETTKETIATIQQLEQGLSDIFSGISSLRMQEIEAESKARMDALDEEFSYRTAYDDQLKALDEADKADRMKDLQDELAAAVAAGDTELAAEKQREIDRMNITAAKAKADEEYAARKSALDKEMAIKKATEERKLAEIQKALRITEITLNTAAGIVSAYTPYIPVLSEIRAGIVAGVGIAQGAIAAATPLPEIPAFAKGVRDFVGGMAVVGEQGAELVNLPSGSDVVSNNGLSQFRDTMNSRAYTSDVAGGAGGGGNSSVINIGNIELPNVTDAFSFFEEMQRYARENQGIA